MNVVLKLWRKLFRAKPTCVLVDQVLHHTDANLALHGQRCAPTKLLTAGFRFRHPAVRSAIRDLLAP